MDLNGTCADAQRPVTVKSIVSRGDGEIAAGNIHGSIGMNCVVGSIQFKYPAGN